jgi:hypothetical protein
MSSSTPHCWARPDIPIDRVHVFGIEIRGVDIPSSVSTPVDSFREILTRCALFHEDQLEGSILSWSIHSPIILPFKILEGIANEAGEDGANAMYEVACEAIRTRAAPDGNFPEALLSSDNISSNILPAHITFCCFYRWGQENTHGIKLKKYFVWKAAEKEAMKYGVTVDSYLSDITHTGGSRASFFGKVKVSQFFSALKSAGYMTDDNISVNKQLISASASTSASASVSASAFVTTPYIGLGIGIVTLEAWLHASLPGCDAVCYHEAIGHGLNLPHPSIKQEFCVMSVAQYQGILLYDKSNTTQKIIICDEIKSGMYSNLSHVCESQSHSTRSTTTADKDVTSSENRNAHACLKALLGSSNLAWFWVDEETDSTDRFSDDSLSFTTLFRQDPILKSTMDTTCLLCGAQCSNLDTNTLNETSITTGSGLSLYPQRRDVSISVCESLNEAQGIALSMSNDMSAADRSILAASERCISKLFNAAERERDGSAQRERDVAALLTDRTSQMSTTGGNMKISDDLVAVAGSEWKETIITTTAGTLTKRVAYSFREVYFGDVNDVPKIIQRYCKQCLSSALVPPSQFARDSILEKVSPISLSSSASLSSSPCASAYLFLLDSSRGLSIALPLCGDKALISSTGLFGPWYHFHKGYWH